MLKEVPWPVPEWLAIQQGYACVHEYASSTRCYMGYHWGNREHLMQRRNRVQILALPSLPCFAPFSESVSVAMPSTG